MSFQCGYHTICTLKHNRKDQGGAILNTSPGTNRSVHVGACSGRAGGALKTRGGSHRGRDTEE